MYLDQPRRDASCMLNFHPAQIYSHIVGESVTFPLNNLESVLVRDFLLHSLICIIPALSNPCQPQDLFYFYFILTEHCVCPPTPCTLEHHKQVAGVLSSMWAVFQWQIFCGRLCEILAFL